MLTFSSHGLEKVLRLCMIAVPLVSVLSAQTPGGAYESKPIGQLNAWETNMTQFGKQYCNTITRDFTQYDPERVFYQIASYTSLPDWNLCANQAETVYRDGWIIPYQGAIRADWVYTGGLKLDYLKTNDSISKDAVLLLAQNSLVATDATAVTDTVPSSMSREVALALMAYVDSMELGAAKPAKFDAFVTQALGHIDQWLVQGASYTPELVGLTMQALIQVYGYQQANGLTPDSRIPDKVKSALDALWTIWTPATNGFNGDPSFNLLVAPAYAWYYLLTGQSSNGMYRDQADAIFNGGVLNAPLDSPLSFNQNYMWSFDYVSWRQKANALAVPAKPANQPPVCTNVKAVPSTLWPPNHKLVPIQIIGISDPDGDAVTLSMKVTVNDAEARRDDRHAAPDVVMQGGTLKLRAEKGEHGKDRIYTIDLTATDGKGGSCTGVVTVTVPHKSKAARLGDDDDDNDRDNRHNKNGDRHGDKDNGKGKDRDKHDDRDKRGR